MKLEDQVCSLELAKKLKELGIKQDSLFFHVSWAFTKKEIEEKESYHIFSRERCEVNEDLTIKISAFTAAELGEMLPKYIKKANIEYYYAQFPSENLDKWIIFYRNFFYSWNGQNQEDVNEANARAKMLIYLLENNLMEINK